MLGTRNLLHYNAKGIENFSHYSFLLFCTHTVSVTTWWTVSFQDTLLYKEAAIVLLQKSDWPIDPIHYCCNVGRPPTSPFELFSMFEDFVGKLDADGKEYYTMGDFNCNMLPASFYKANTQALLNVTDIYNLKQLITEPTRITPLSSTLIDVIFTNLLDNTSYLFWSVSFWN